MLNKSIEMIINYCKMEKVTLFYVFDFNNDEYDFYFIKNSNKINITVEVEQLSKWDENITLGFIQKVFTKLNEMDIERLKNKLNTH